MAGGRPTGYRPPCSYIHTEEDMRKWLLEWHASPYVIERKKKRNSWKRKNLLESPSRRIRNATEARMWTALKGRSDGKLFSRLTYSLSDLVNHLETKFADGMSWENYGDWHIDHIKPCALFDQTKPEEFTECWNLKNLQPLWESENVRKGAFYVCT